MRSAQLFALGVGVCLLAAATATAQQIDDATVTAALQAGLDEDRLDDLIDDCTARPGFGESMGAAFRAGVTGGPTLTGEYRVTVSTHLGQIAELAAQRKKRYLPPATVADVPNELRQPMVYVWIEPLGDSSTYDGTLNLASIIEHVVARAEDRPERTAQPTSIEMEPASFWNLLGAEYTANRAVVTFDVDAVRSMIEDRDFEIVVITEAGERRCNIGKDDVRKMFELRR